MNESVQKKLTKVRPPRVKITYDVETGGAAKKKELPFVGAILANLAGDNSDGQDAYRDRKFIDLDNDNFDEVLAGISPNISFAVDNKLTDGSGQMNISLNFNEISDFSPDNIIQQVEPLRKLYEARSKLNDLAAKLDGNDQLDGLLSEVIANTEVRQQVASSLPKESADDSKSEKAKKTDSKNTDKSSDE